MTVLEFLKDNIVILDGGMGTLLQSSGLCAGELPERWNITHPQVIQDIHKAYFDAGSNIVNTNTFGANSLKFSSEELEQIVSSAIENARIAANQSASNAPKFVALDIGPTGHLLKPYGDLDFEDAVAVFAETVRLGVKYGADLVMIETMNDSYETKAALLAVKENSNLPVFVSNAYGADGKLMTGADVGAMVALLEGMGADAIGLNCSLGPKQLAPLVDEYLRLSSVPVLVKPNAGLPKVEDGKTVYNVLPQEFSCDVADFLKKGVRIAGGCCGTTPEYIAELVKKAADVPVSEITPKNITAVSSYTHAVTFGEDVCLIGERINPTGKKRFKEALRNNDIGYILNEGISQKEKGVHILDVNVGLPEINETEMLKTAVCELQAVLDLPLQIDTADDVAMETALRVYNGKAMINSVNGKRESMEKIFPLVKKYGGVVVALTLDENGIPETAQGRVEIAKKILSVAREYGIDKKDIVFDTLAMTVSADNTAAKTTLEALYRIKNELGCNTSLGVSNVSFGLPERDTVNQIFFTCALEKGLSAAIMNPYSDKMMQAYYAFRVLHALDENCAEYIEFAQSQSETHESSVAATVTTLKDAVVKGLGDLAAKLTEQRLCECDGLTIVQEEIIPALDIVGKGFEEKRMFLPQLLMSADAAKNAFEKIKAAMSHKNSSSPDKGQIVIATVKGDIHDIGKNIVKLLLENYGYTVTDLGKDVSPQDVLEAVQKTHAPLVGLSALMTTTVPAMEETVKLLRQKAPQCKIMVGGAVLTPEYAESIGADMYAPDAMGAVRCAEKIFGI